MKKRLLIMLLMIAVLVCLFAISVSAAKQSYTTFDVVLADGTEKTAYSPGAEQWQGRVYLTPTIYAEAPFDSEETYETIDWADVRVLDFSNSMIYFYSNNKYTEMAYGHNQNGTAMFIMKNGATSKDLANVEKIITGKASTIGGGVFANMANLKEVVISPNTQEIQYNAFEKNPSLTKISFSEDGKFTTLRQQAFIGCTALKTISLPNTITSMESKVFQDCTNLESVLWPTKITSIPDSTFYNCSSLVFEIPEQVTAIGSSAFYNCDSLVRFVIPDRITTIGSFILAECNNLEEVVITEGSLITSKLIGIIKGCPKITSFRMPPLVTEMGYDNFWNCTSLSEVIWPNNLTSITGGAPVLH